MIEAYPTEDRYGGRRYLKGRRLVIAAIVSVAILAEIVFGWLVYLTVRLPPLYQERWETSRLCNALSERYPTVQFQAGQRSAGRITVRVGGHFEKDRHQEIRDWAAAESSRLGFKSRVTVYFADDRDTDGQGGNGNR